MHGSGKNVPNKVRFPELQHFVIGIVITVLTTNGHYNRSK